MAKLKDWTGKRFSRHFNNTVAEALLSKFRSVFAKEERKLLTKGEGAAKKKKVVSCSLSLRKTSLFSSIAGIHYTRNQ